MAIDASKSFEISEHGLSVDGGVHVSSGTAVPTHTAAQGSWYWRKDTNEVYQNQDGAVDWQIFSSGGGSGNAATEEFTKVGHGLAVGDVVRHSGANPEDFVKAQADSGANSEALGIVSAVSGNDFTVTYSGRITGLSGLTADTVYYLSAATAGLLTSTEPTISKPMLFATGTTAGVVLVMRAMTVEGEADKVHRYGHGYAVTGQIKVASGDNNFIPPFFVSLETGQTTKLVKARYKINSGTNCVLKLQKNGSDITGFTGMTATTTAASTAPTGVSLAEDDRIALVVDSVSGTPKNLSFTMFFEVTQ